jgi:hypothetical protein
VYINVQASQKYFEALEIIPNILVFWAPRVKNLCHREGVGSLSGLMITIFDEDAQLQTGLVPRTGTRQSLEVRAVSE